jgi:hypothetical protein
VLETVTRVLELAERPMRAREIHTAAEQLVGEPLLWTSVKAALAAYASGPGQRFRRIRRGYYQVAERSDGSWSGRGAEAGTGGSFRSGKRGRR